MTVELDSLGRRIKQASCDPNGVLPENWSDWACNNFAREIHAHVERVAVDTLRRLLAEVASIKHPPDSDAVVLHCMGIARLNEEESAFVNRLLHMEGGKL